MKISVIIATYNRFDQLMQAIKSIRDQTYKVSEIIVVNDNSTDVRYYNRRLCDVKLIHLDTNTRFKFGYPCAGYARSVGISAATSEFIAILDDDDYFLKDKLEIQVSEMKKYNSHFCATEGLMGYGIYKSTKNYPKYHCDYYKSFCENFFMSNYGSYSNQLPNFFDSKLIEMHNFIIHSSVIYSKELYEMAQCYSNVVNGEEDWGLFKRMLQFTNCLYLNDPLVYYSGKNEV